MRWDMILMKSADYLRLDLNKKLVDELGQAEFNKIKVSNGNQQEQSNMETIEFIVDYRKKAIKVCLEFPQISDNQSVHNFETLLKEIYLKKIEILFGQKGKSALYC